MVALRLSIGRTLLVLAALCGATSCVMPGRERPTALHDKPVARAAPLLSALDLTVAPISAPAQAQPSILKTVLALPQAAPAFAGVARSADDVRRAADCLTAAVYYEARSESVDGQRAVAQVVLNRVRDRAFPSSVCGVVYQGSTRRTGCQFSFTCDGSMLAPRDPHAWARAAVVAADTLSGTVYAPIGSATFYHTTAVSPWWAPSLARITNIGAHIFYRWKGPLENALAFRQRYSGVEPMPTVIAPTPASPVAPTADLVQTVMTEGSTVLVHHGRASEPEAVPVAVPATLAPAAPAVHQAIQAGVRIHRIVRHGTDEAADTPSQPEPTTT